MAWVRYDDNFYSNPKVTRVVGEDPGALALHLLANTWTNAQKHPGFVPAHQAAILLCDRQRAAEWALILVRAGLWHERDKVCAECAEEYANLPADAVGYVFHNAKEYRAPARERTTPGVSTELSEKRREAGRKGGRISADRRKQDEAKQEQAKEASQASASVAQASGQANRKQTQERAAVTGQANSTVQLTDSNAATPPPAQTGMNDVGFAGVSKPSNLLLAGVSPEPEPEPVPPTPKDLLRSADAEALFDTPSKPETANQRVNRVTRIYTDRVKLTNFVAVQQVVKDALKCGDYAEEQVVAGLNHLAESRATVTKNALRHAIEGTMPWPTNRPTQGRAGSGLVPNPRQNGGLVIARPSTGAPRESAQVRKARDYAEIGAALDAQLMNGGFDDPR